jgi:hypothetical protein
MIDYSKINIDSFKASLYNNIKSSLIDNNYSNIEEFLNLVSYSKLFNAQLNANIDINYLYDIIESEGGGYLDLLILLYHTYFENITSIPINTNIFRDLHNKIEKNIISVGDLFNITPYSEKLLGILNIKGIELDNEFSKFIVEKDIKFNIFDITINIINKIDDNTLYKLFASYLLKHYIKGITDKSDISLKINRVSDLFYDTDILVKVLKDKSISDSDIMYVLSNMEMESNLFNDRTINIYTDFIEESEFKLIRSNYEDEKVLDILSNSIFNYFNFKLDIEDTSKIVKISNTKSNNLYERLLLIQYQIILFTKDNRKSTEDDISFKSPFKISKSILNDYKNSDSLDLFTNPNLLLLDLHLIKSGLVKTPNIDNILTLYKSYNRDILSTKEQFKILNRLKSNLDFNLNDIISDIEDDKFSYMNYFSKLLIRDSIKDIYMKDIDLKDISRDG